VNQANNISKLDTDYWMNNLKRNDKNKIIPSSSNVELILSNHVDWAGKIAFDEFSGKFVIKKEVDGIDGIIPGEFTDTAEALICHWLSVFYNIDVNSRVFGHALTAAAYKNKFHPVKDFLNTLKWDEKERLPNLFADIFDPPCDTEPGYLAFVAVKFFIGAIARIEQPGCKMDNVLILESNQGKKKSTLIGEMFPWSADTPLAIGDKDAVLNIQGVWVYEVSELQSFNNVEATKSKAFFSTAEDLIRVPYGRSAQKFPRQTVFIGTTNETEYFKDHTGNRRYWPVRCTTVDLEYVKENRDQILAEALHRYRQGESWWPETEEENRMLMVEQDKRLRVDPWQYLIEDFVTSNSFDWIQSNEILTDCIGKSAQSIQKTADQMRVGAIMRAMGWENKIKRIEVPGRKNKLQRHVYVRPSDWRFGNSGIAND